MKAVSKSETTEIRAIGIDIGGSTTKIAVLSGSGVIHRLETLPTPRESPPGEYLRSVFDCAEQLAAAHDAAGRVGIGVAGFVDPQRRRMFYNPNLHWLQGFELAAAFEQKFGGLVQLDADSNAACLAEYRWGAGRGHPRFLCIAIGTGVGGGMIAGGEIVRLAHGGLGDIGHVIVQPDGPECGSGCHGCAEALISAPAIAERARAFAGTVTPREVIDLARGGHQEAVRLLAATGRLLGIALASQAVITFPDCIAIGGGIAEAGDLLLKPAEDTFRRAVGPFYRDEVVITRAELGWKATVMGAAALALPAV